MRAGALTEFMHDKLGKEDEMKFETKFSPGDVVWNISNTKIKVLFSCSFCAGTGKIQGADGEKRSCPECYGRCSDYKWEDKGWTISQENPQLTIGQVRVKFTGEWEGISDTFSNYGPQGEEHKEEYMCRETGIGSGAIHRAERLFTTKKEAQAECDRLNRR